MKNKIKENKKQQVIQTIKILYNGYKIIEVIKLILDNIL